MSDDIKIGLGTAFDVLMADDDATPGDDAEQLPLLPLDQPADVTGDPLPAPRRIGGRPKGATNKSTREWTDYILKTRQSPLLVMADFCSLTVDDLASRLKCDLLDAARLQLIAADKLALYVHKKQPAATDGEAPPVPLMISVSPEVGRMIEGAQSRRSDGGVEVNAEVIDNAEESKG